MAIDARSRDLLEALRRDQFCVVVRRTEDGRFRARAYCLHDFRRDLEQDGDSELAAIEAIARRAGLPEAAHGHMGT